MNNTTLHNSAAIEAILFATAESYSIATLAKMLELSLEDIEAALIELDALLVPHAFMLVRHADAVTLATRPEHSSMLEILRKEELQKDLSKASAETLAVVVYHPGATKAEIELIRGVNASYSLRALHIRGLIETKNNGKNVTYYPTITLLESYGVATVEELPHYIETKQKIDSLL